MAAMAATIDVARRPVLERKASSAAASSRSAQRRALTPTVSRVRPASACMCRSRAPPRAHTQTVTIDPSGRPLLPVACTLGPLDGAQRLEEWRRLSATTGLGKELAGGKLTLRFQ